MKYLLIAIFFLVSVNASATCVLQEIAYAKANEARNVYFRVLWAKKKSGKVISKSELKKMQAMEIKAYDARVNYERCLGHYLE